MAASSTFRSPGLLALVALLVSGVNSPGVAQAPAWQVLENSPYVGYPHEDISFPSPLVGWIVGSRSVYRTVDGGVSWSEQSIPGRRFRSSGFISEDVGWVGTLDPARVLFETRDGGRNWKDISGQITGFSVRGICAIWPIDDSTVVAVGRYDGAPTFLKSVDRGRSWRATAVTEVGSLVDVVFLNGTTGFAVGGTHGVRPESRAAVLGTTDGGETWSVRHVSSLEGEWAWKIAFPTPETGYVAVENRAFGRVLKTVDGGVTWTEIKVPENALLQAVGFVTEEIGWVGGHLSTSVTYDGGKSWRQAEFGSGINRIRISSDSVAHAIGTRAFVLRRPGVAPAGPDLASGRGPS